MKPFELIKPDSLQEASRRAAEPGALIKAAGIDVLDRLKERLEKPESLINLLELRTTLSEVTLENERLTVGALATLAAISNAPACAEPRYGALRQSAEKTATPQVRNRATVGGNLLQLTRCWYRRSAELGCAHGGDGPDCLAQNGENRYHAIMKGIDCYRVHPSNLAPALIALDATVTAKNGEKERTLSLLDLYPEDPYADEAEHVLAPGEILTHINVPPQPDGARSAYHDSREKLSFDWATTAAAARIAVVDGKITDARICLGAVAPIPVFAPEAAAILVGQAPSVELFTRCATKAYEASEPLQHNAYKVELGQVILRDALAEAAGMR